MRFLVGLGNPEQDFSWTRHNIGKEVLDTVARAEGVSWKFDRKLSAWIAKNNEWVLCKPESFMNEIGLVVTKVARYYKLPAWETMVVYDDLDLVVGDYKIDFKKGSRIHNGVKSVTEYLKADDIFHCRVGVREESIGASVQKTGRDPGQYVLSKFSFDDKRKLEKLIQESIVPDLSLWLSKKL